MIDRLQEIHDAARLGKNPVIDADDASLLLGAIEAQGDYEELTEVLDDIIDQSGVTQTNDYAHDVRDLSLRFLVVRNALAKLEPGFDLATDEKYAARFDQFITRVVALETVEATLRHVRDVLIDFGAITADDETTDTVQMLNMLLPPACSK